MKLSLNAKIKIVLTLVMIWAVASILHLFVSGPFQENGDYFVIALIISFLVLLLKEEFDYKIQKHNKLKEKEFVDKYYEENPEEKPKDSSLNEVKKGEKRVTKAITIYFVISAILCLAGFVRSLVVVIPEHGLVSGLVHGVLHLMLLITVFALLFVFFFAIFYLLFCFVRGWLNNRSKGKGLGKKKLFFS
jgi:hypothetical protein